MFYETFICFYVSGANLFVSVFVQKCLMLNDDEYTTFKMFVTQMCNYIFISFQLMFYKTLHYRLARALCVKQSLQSDRFLSVVGTIIANVQFFYMEKVVILLVR